MVNGVQSGLSIQATAVPVVYYCMAMSINRLTLFRRRARRGHKREVIPAGQGSRGAEAPAVSPPRRSRPALGFLVHLAVRLAVGLAIVLSERVAERLVHMQSIVLNRKVRALCKAVQNKEEGLAGCSTWLCAAFRYPRMDSGPLLSGPADHSCGARFSFVARGGSIRHSVVGVCASILVHPPLRVAPGSLRRCFRGGP